MCGIVGLISSKDRDDLGALIFHGLYQITNRGDFSSGIATIRRLPWNRQTYRRLRRLAVEHTVDDFNSLNIEKGYGLVTKAFTEEQVGRLKGFMGIGHVRYPTAGYTLTPEQMKLTPEERALMEKESIQPLRTKDYAKIAMAHNGDVNNYDELMEYFQGIGLRRATNNDLEAMLNVFSEEFFDISDNVEDFERVQRAIAGVHKRVDGTYSAVAIVNNVGLVAFRDPQGRRPLFFGVNKQEGQITDYAFASETVALEKMLFKGTLEMKYVDGQHAFDEVRPGEVVFIGKDFQFHRAQVTQPDPHLCPFEGVYFQRAPSFLNDRRVKQIRQDLGELVWERFTDANLDLAEYLTQARENVIICPVPRTANSAAVYLADYLKQHGFSLHEAIEKHPHSPRIFMQPTGKHRSLQTIANHYIFGEEVSGRDIILIEDSIVRGTTLMQDIKYLKDKGAKSVHTFILFPKIVAPCHHAVDFHTSTELFAHNKSLDDMKHALGMGAGDSLTYSTKDDVSRAIGLPLSQLCTDCYNGTR